MEVALGRRVTHDPRLLEEVGRDGCAGETCPRAVLQHEELAEAARVVVHRGARVAQRLEHAVAADQLVVQLRRARGGGPPGCSTPAAFAGLARLAAAHVREVLQHAPAALGLAGAALARDEDALRAARQHALKGLRRHSENVRRRRRAVTKLAVAHHDRRGVEAEVGVRVDGEHHGVDRRVDLVGIVPLRGGKERDAAQG